MVYIARARRSVADIPHGGDKKEYLLGKYVSREAAQKMCDSLNRRGKR